MEVNKGKVTGLAHLGYGAENTYELLGYYGTVFGIANAMSQDIRHPYIGRINGVTGCPYVIGFVRSENDETRLEFVGCVNAVKGHAIYPPEIGGHMHMVYTTGDLDACYERMRTHHVTLYGAIDTIDYGLHMGRRAFFVRDLNGIYIQIVEDPSSQVKDGTFDRLVGASYTVTDFDRCLKHFSKGLGLQTEIFDLAVSGYLARLDGPTAPKRGAYVRVNDRDDFVIELLDAEKPNPATSEIWVNSLGCLHICVMVDDIQSVYDRMTALGMKFVGPPSPVELGINKGAKAIFSKISNEILLELFQGKATAV